jgi:hypothetical protein
MPARRVGASEFMIVLYLTRYYYASPVYNRYTMVVCGFFERLHLRLGFRTRRPLSRNTASPKFCPAKDTDRFALAKLCRLFLLGILRHSPTGSLDIGPLPRAGCWLTQHLNLLRRENLRKASSRPDMNYCVAAFREACARRSGHTANHSRYTAVLESYSRPLLEFVEWEPTPEGNVRGLNDTADYYRYFDATAHAEFLYGCVEETVDEDLPQELILRLMIVSRGPYKEP